MKKLSLRSLIPNLFTFISLTFGLTAIKFAIEEKWQISVSLIVFASFLDNIDGKLARLLKTNSDFGIPSLRNFENEVKKYCYMWRDGGQFSTEKYNSDIKGKN